MKRKRVGSTLLTVITICSAILITGTGLVAMTVGEYKMKQAQSNRTHNLYGADSGLDAAYDAMIADFDAAGNYAGNKVKKLKAGNGDWKENQDKYTMLEEEESQLVDKYKEDPDAAKKIERERKRIQKNKDIVINAEFQRFFKLFLYSKWITNDENGKNMLNYINVTGDSKFINYAAAVGENDNVTLSGIQLNSGNNPIIEINCSDIKLSDNPSDINAQNIDNVQVGTGEGEYAQPDNYKIKQSSTIKITSKFKTSKGNNGEAVVGANERTVESTYNLIIPNYDDIYFTEQEYKPYDFKVYEDKGITVFGNMQVKDMGNSKLSVDKGKVFVYGDLNNLPNEDLSGTGKNVSTATVSSKYKGGISLDSISGQTQVEFADDVYTASTFNIQRNVDVRFTGDNNNLYALNVYAGRQNGEVGDKSSLNLGAMTLDNDLTLKSTAANINMNSFYGINDVTDSGSLDEKKRNSSSIIVNTYKNDTNDIKSSINIRSQAYIMGVSYIDTGDGYQTGESVGVKGNYKAYSKEAAEDQNKYSYGPNGTLYLMNGKVLDNNTIDPNLTLDNKVKHFVNYWSEDKNKGELQDGGVQLPKAIGDIHSVGAIVYNDGNGPQVAQSSYNLNDDSTIRAQKIKYAKNVYNLGEDLNLNNGKTEDENLYDLYSGVSENSKGAVIDRFMNLNNIYDSESGNVIDSDGNKGIFNKVSSKKIIITDDTSKYENDSNNIVLDASSGSISAFIATAGDVIIDGKIKLKGNIIAEGNLIIQNAGDKTITYDPEVAQAIQRENPGVFMRAFKNMNNRNNSDSDNLNSNLKIDYDLGKFLKNLLWQIQDNKKQ